MKLRQALTIVLAALLLFSCGSNGLLPFARSSPEAQPLHGTSTAAFELAHSAAGTALVINQLDQAGVFARVTGLDVLAGPVLLNPSDPNVLAAAIPNGDAVDIGIAPLPSYGGGPLRIDLGGLSSAKAVSSPPKGSTNRVTDLSVSELEVDQVVLEWTEVNTGDYDFNSEVNISDLLPIALNYGEQYDREAPGSTELTEYWVDGDRNGEINVADLVVIAVNFGNQVSGYYVLRNSIPVMDEDTGLPLLVSRLSASIDNTENPLPPVYTFSTTGSSTDDWSVVPVDDAGEQGTISAGLVTGNTFDAKVTPIINGVNLWPFPGYDPEDNGGFAKLRVILPIDDVDFAEVGDHLDGLNGTAIFDNIPREQELFLEIAFAPKTHLVTRETLTQEKSTGDPFRTRMPFTLPPGIGLTKFSPEITISNVDDDIRLDLFATIESGGETEIVRSRLLLRAGLVSYDTDKDASFIDQPFLSDPDLDSLSTARIRLTLDLADYANGNTGETLHRGKVKLFDEASGYVVLEEAEFWDPDMGFTPVPLPAEVAYNFYELTEFGEAGELFLTPANIVPGDTLEITGYFLSDFVAGLPQKNWAETILRVPTS